MTQDYVGSFKTNKGSELLHFGVKGMKWGVRKERSSGSSGGSSKAKPTKARVQELKDSANAKQHAALTARIDRLKSGAGRPLIVKGKQLSKAESIKHLEEQAKKVAPKTKVEPKAPKKSDIEGETVKLSDGTEITFGKLLSVSKDFETLKTQVREKGANSLTDDELKYVNARTEAVRKANEAYKQPDSWLAKTVKNTVQSELEKQARNASGLLAEKFIGENLKSKLAGKQETATERFTRLETKISTTGKDSLSDDELKYVLSRRETLSKV